MSNFCKILVLSVLLALSSKPTFAELRFYTGNSWLKACGSYPTGNISIDKYCEGYTQGVIEGLMWGPWAAQTFLGSREPKVGETHFCLSSTQTWSQYVLVVKKEANNLPEVLDKPAPILIYMALDLAFPCKK